MRAHRPMHVRCFAACTDGEALPARAASLLSQLIKRCVHEALFCPGCLLAMRAEGLIKR